MELLNSREIEGLQGRVSDPMERSEQTYFYEHRAGELTSGYAVDTAQTITSPTLSEPLPIASRAMRHLNSCDRGKHRHELDWLVSTMKREPQTNVTDMEPATLVARLPRRETLLQRCDSSAEHFSATPALRRGARRGGRCGAVWEPTWSESWHCLDWMVGPPGLEPGTNEL